MTATSGPMLAVPTFTPREAVVSRVPDETDPYSAPARDIAVAAALTGHKLADSEDIAQLPRRVSSRPDTRTAQAGDWGFLLHLQHALKAWSPDPRTPARDGEQIYAGVRASATGSRPVQDAPVPQRPAWPPLPADDGWMRDLIAASLRDRACNRGGVTAVCPDCRRTGRPCRRHAAMVAEAASLWALADLVASCAGTRDALLALSVAGQEASPRD